MTDSADMLARRLRWTIGAVVAAGAIFLISSSRTPTPAEPTKRSASDAGDKAWTDRVVEHCKHTAGIAGKTTLDKADVVLFTTCVEGAKAGRLQP